MAAQESAANPICKSRKVALASRWRFKRAAIVFAEDNGNHSAAAEFGVDRACIIRWRKQRNQILKGAATRKKFTGPRKGRHPELEEEVCEFVHSERSRGFAVTADALQTKAMEIARRMEIPRARGHGSECGSCAAGLNHFWSEPS
ncbi:hypothetical protein HPB52_002203 [Rhipicephalus sanguineus]|uniref:HTH CENPB-type domain-containing protein n=1 Tax=Rhipicephalus sanguineus TaxID=34632 RepID=A0A9D4T507_RHISA|nr:hypothetical protein HPB52_002203 [Rhipicephalus sanguineus]